MGRAVGAADAISATGWIMTRWHSLAIVLFLFYNVNIVICSRNRVSDALRSGTLAQLRR